VSTRAQRTLSLENEMNGRWIDPFAHDHSEASATVLAAMSGGVDSAVSALMLRDAGFRVVGLTMRNYCYGASAASERSCCSTEAIEDARRECDRLGIPHRVADVEDVFGREVIDDFLYEYRRLRTPNPCVRCNTIVRFHTLLEYAGILGADYVATGHYARVFARGDGARFIGRAVDRDKDQSYFLSGVRGGILERVLFPLGGLGKSDVRARAREAGMAVSEKSESQEVCFVTRGGLKKFLESRSVTSAPGPIENTRGEILGTHTGLAGHTVGQRRHIGIATGAPQYVVRLDGARNVLVVGSEGDLSNIRLGCTFDWFDPAALETSDGLFAQIRYRHTPALVKRLSIERPLGVGTPGRVEFREPQRAVCPGQTIALYRGDVVVGAGVIDESE
jgi:tRNA-specific 2-thiouridylase